jgi:hypothetical protein
MTLLLWLLVVVLSAVGLVAVWWLWAFYQMYQFIGSLER